MQVTHAANDNGSQKIPHLKDRNFNEESRLKLLVGFNVGSLPHGPLI